MPALSATKQRNRNEGSELDRKKLRAERRNAQRSKEAQAEAVVEGSKTPEPRHLVEPTSPMNSATKNKARREKQRSREGAGGSDASPGAASPEGASAAASPPPPRHELSPMSPMGQSAKNKARRDKARARQVAEGDTSAASPAGSSPAAVAHTAASADPPKHEMSPMSPMTASQRNAARRQKQRASEASGAANASAGGSSPEARAAAAACCDSDEEASPAPSCYAGPGKSKNTWNLRTQVPGESAEIYMRNKERRDAYRCKKDPTFVPSKVAAKE